MPSLVFMNDSAMDRIDGTVLLSSFTKRSRTAVAKAAEEDVDSFIIKPYTLQSIQDNLLSTIYTKLKPSPYIQKIEEGKARIFEQNYDAAIVVLKEAIFLHPKPSLALFYIGQAQYFKREKEEAKDKYHEGLEFNSIHYLEVS